MWSYILNINAYMTVSYKTFNCISTKIKMRYKYSYLKKCEHIYINIYVGVIGRLFVLKKQTIS